MKGSVIEFDAWNTQRLLMAVTADYCAPFMQDLWPRDLELAFSDAREQLDEIVVIMDRSLKKKPRQRRELVEYGMCALREELARIRGWRRLRMKWIVDEYLLLEAKRRSAALVEHYAPFVADARANASALLRLIPE